MGEKTKKPWARGEERETDRDRDTDTERHRQIDRDRQTERDREEEGKVKKLKFTCHVVDGVFSAHV